MKEKQLGMGESQVLAGITGTSPYSGLRCSKADYPGVQSNCLFSKVNMENYLWLLS